MKFPSLKRTIALGVIGLTIHTIPAAQNRPAFSDNVIRIGVLTDLSGTFVDNVGPGSVLATQLAVEEFGGKVHGVPIEVVSADHQNKADIGSSKAREWYDRDRVDVVTELGNSAVALSVMKVAADKNKITMVTGAGATRISGADCTATNVQWVYDTYALAKVGTQSLVQGGVKSWYFMTADYAFGHSLESDGIGFVRASGGQVVGSARYPFPASDFASLAVQAQASGAQAVAFATAGGDLQNAIKQSTEFGLSKKQKLVAMLMSIVDVHSLGLKQAQGMNFAETFYWDRDDASRKFSKRFFERHKRMPTALQAGQYSAVLSYLKAVQTARTDDTAEVMKVLKSMPIEDGFAKNGRVRADGKMIHDLYLVEVKTPQESQSPWDYYKILKTVPGATAFGPQDFNCRIKSETRASPAAPAETRRSKP